MPVLQHHTKLERLILSRIVTDALAAGYSLDVYDGEEFTVRDSRDPSAILAALQTTDEDRLYFRRDGKRIGWVFFVYGNSGWDVVNDHTTNLEDFMKGVDALADQLERGEYDVIPQAPADTGRPSILDSALPWGMLRSPLGPKG